MNNFYKSLLLLTLVFSSCTKDSDDTITLEEAEEIVKSQPEVEELFKNHQDLMPGIVGDDSPDNPCCWRLQVTSFNETMTLRTNFGLYEVDKKTGAITEQ